MVYFKIEDDGLVTNIAFVRPADSDAWHAVEALPAHDYGDKVYFVDGAFRVVRRAREEARASRAEAYAATVDPITCEIARLRDMGGTADEIAEAEARREAAVSAIKAQFPYPEGAE